MATSNKPFCPDMMSVITIARKPECRGDVCLCVVGASQACVLLVWPHTKTKRCKSSTMRISTDRGRFANGQQTFYEFEHAKNPKHAQHTKGTQRVDLLASETKAQVVRMASSNNWPDTRVVTVLGLSATRSGTSQPLGTVPKCSWGSGAHPGRLRQRSACVWL